MKRTRKLRIAGMVTLGLMVASLLIAGCGDSPTGSLSTGDDDVVVKPDNAGYNDDTSRDGSKGTEQGS